MTANKRIPFDRIESSRVSRIDSRRIAGREYSTVQYRTTVQYTRMHRVRCASKFESTAKESEQQNE